MSDNPNFETAADLWRWYTQDYLPEIIEPESFLSLIVEKLKESDLSKVFDNIKNIFMPKKLKTPAQEGGGLFSQTDYKIDSYHTFRLDAYNELITYLTDNNIKISLLTKQLLKKLYLYHYSIEYIKVLNYILLKIKHYTLPDELQIYTANLFEQIRNEIYDKLIT